MDKNVRNYLDEIQRQTFFGEVQTDGSLKFNMRWYRSKASTAHRYFRGFGFVTILLSVSLPFVVSIWNEVWVASMLSWLIALTGGANGFFQWGKSWQSRTEAYLRLERLLMEWEVAVQKNGLMVDDVSTLTMKLILDARETIKAETGAFFEEIQFPEVNDKPLTDDYKNRKDDKSVGVSPKDPDKGG